MPSKKARHFTYDTTYPLYPKTCKDKLDMGQ